MDVDVDVALIGCPAHGGQGYIAAMAALLDYCLYPLILSRS